MKPALVTVLGETFKIKYKPMISKSDTGEGDYGQMVFDERVIYIDDQLKGRHLESTLFHEMIHAALAVSGHTFLLSEKEEESLVRALEHALMPNIALKILKFKKD